MRCLASPPTKNSPMPVYRADLLGASTCPGCWCRDRVPRYPSDLTDAQWEVLRPEAEQVMDELRRAAGRPMVHQLRAMVDAIAYVTRNRIEWRALPVDFPPWQAVYAFFQRWNQRGLPQRLTGRLLTVVLDDDVEVGVRHRGC